MFIPIYSDTIAPGKCYDDYGEEFSYPVYFPQVSVLYIEPA
ncbi:MAG: hypothetical protein ABFC28_02320 [Rikenellaceae bacterium]